MSDSIQKEQRSSMLQRLLGHGSYESFEMRCVVSGQSGTGKSSLIALLVGDNIPEGRHLNDGISLQESRCEIDLETRNWIHINPATYSAMDDVYNKVLKFSVEEEKGQLDKQPLADQSFRPKTHMKAKMTKDKIRKSMEKVLKSGKYNKRKMGQLIFWDIDVTCQTFINFRAVFLVVFDGSKRLHRQDDALCIPGQHITPTPAAYLQYLVNCILTYCTAVYTDIPKILFVATHKDKIPKNVETQREEVYSGIEELFKNHEGRKHLVLNQKIFVNATDESDPEIDVLKKTITDLTFQHPCWGERLPNVSVPLELEIADLVSEGKHILSLTEVEELNASSKVSILSFDQLREFLHLQNLQGKIVYFDIPHLRDCVIINPTLLVEIMRSFVKDKGFWPKRVDIRQIFERMSESGIMQRRDLYHIWEQKHFNKLLPYKEVIFDMLIHLDILSEQRRYDLITGSRLPVENFFVPCMLTQINDTRFMAHECTPEKAISLAFVFKGTILPPALPNRLISACLSMWAVKTFEGNQLLFSGFVGLSFDKALDIVVCVEGNKILLYIVHETSNGLIVPDIATGIKECMFTTIERISEFYKSTVHVSSSSQKLPFHIEYACSRLECHITEEAALTTDEWICHKHKIVHTNNKWNIWNQDQTKEECEVECQGLNEDALNQIPSDIELQRFVSGCDEVTILELAIRLGMSFQEWEDLKKYYKIYNNVKYRILINWREKCLGKFRNIAKALTDMHLSTHLLCQARRTKKGYYDISEEYMDLIPTDEILDRLSQVIGVVSFQLGIELGLPITLIDIIQHNNGRDLVAQCKDILFQWREDQRVKPTIDVLANALVNVGRGTVYFEEIIKNVKKVGVEKYIPLKEVEEERKGKIQTFLKKLNPFQKKIPIDSLKTGSEALMYRLERMQPADFKMFIAKGDYESFENRVYLAGACNVGKSCLASILIGEEIPKKWISTNGLTIYFGRNGIHLEDKKMVTLVKSDTNIMKKLLLGKPHIVSKKERNVEKPLLSKQRNDNEEATDRKDPALNLSTLNTDEHELKYSDQKQENKSPSKKKGENPDVPSLTENVKTNLPPYTQKYPKQKAFTIQSGLSKEIRTGKYKIKIAPSDLVDFGGQRSFDMTHQLFIQHKGTFVLMFDGRYELHTPLKEYPKGETGKDILVHWVNSILVYCKEDDDLLPMILFAATHSDCFLKKDALFAKKTRLTQEITELFSTHVKKGHIMYDRVFFINATNANDSEIELLKDKLVDIASRQSTWGERMPIAWVPLELQISEMRANNVSVIQKKEVQELNRLNEEFALTEHLIDAFLRIQHSLGKILYFDFPGLDKFIVVQPTVMVNILRSFITDKMFWPEQQDLRKILKNTTNTGTIKKLQLFQLWSQSPFDVYLPTDPHKEYIINVLVHLDILVKPKHESKIETIDQSYMVPSVVNTPLPVDLPYEEQKTICLSYYLKECAIPPALIFKLIATAVITWPLKEIDGRPCLFSQSAILNIDVNNELLIATKDQRVILYLTNKVSRDRISPDVAASIQECMTSALQRILHFYQECFGQTSVKIDEISLFEIEVGCIHNKEPCLVSLESAIGKEGWVCGNTCNKIKHDTKYCLYWIFKKTETLVVQTNTCSSLECKGLSTETLSPSNHQLVQIVNLMSLEYFRPFIIFLGLSVNKWEDILFQYRVNGLMGVKLMAMYVLKTEKETISQKVRFKDLWKSLDSIEIWPHHLCQILKEDTNLIDTDSSTLQEIPSDEVLNLLPRKMGNCVIELGLELGLSFSCIQETMYRYHKDMYEQLYDILRKWKQSSKSRPSVLNLMKALQQTQSGGMEFLQEQYKHN